MGMGIWKLGSEWKTNWAGNSEDQVAREGELGSPSKSEFRGKIRVAIRTRECDRGTYRILPDVCHSCLHLSPFHGECPHAIQNQKQNKTTTNETKTQAARRHQEGPAPSIRLLCSCGLSMSQVVPECCFRYFLRKRP